MQASMFEVMSKSVAEATGQVSVQLKSAGSGFGGGGGAAVGTVEDAATGKRYFYKSGSLAQFDMLRAEYMGVKAMHDTHTIRVPEPICIGTADYNSFVVFEHLPMGGHGDPARAGRELAAMHRNLSPNGQFGFDISNTCGATPQPNPWTPTWAEFWDRHRLGHMLSLAKRDGAVFPDEERLRKKVYDILSAHNPVPSLVHGDLWSGNQAYTKNGDPVIFDPATYYGDREVDIAMTYLFGSQASSYYQAYEQEWPLQPGFEQRKVIYNLYHILNHFVLFGGGYLSQANSMIHKILSF